MGGWVSILQWMFSLFFMFGIALDVTVILVAIKAQMREHAYYGSLALRSWMF
jgi:hypothetical protein